MVQLSLNDEVDFYDTIEDFVQVILLPNAVDKTKVEKAKQEAERRAKQRSERKY